MRKIFLPVAVALAAGLALLPTAAAPAQPPQRFEFTQPHMGTTFRLVFYAKDQATADRAAKAAFARAAALDQIMSDYKQDSELMRLCKQAGGDPVKVSPELFEVLRRAQKLSELSDGAFDVSCGPVVKLWRRARRTQQLPPADELKKALGLVDYRKIKLNAAGRTVQLLLAGMLLDLGGIAKGYAAELLLALLREHGITQALVAAGGDIMVGEPPPGAKGWKIGVAPLENPNARPKTFVLVRNAGVSTSGDTEQYVEIDGKRYGHHIDLKTGLGVVRRGSVTVVMPGATADGWAGTLCVLGPERGLKLIEAVDGAAALFVTATEQGQVVQRSRRFAAFAVKE
jgi:thiamine biosynthesis lipoprotein